MLWGDRNKAAAGSSRWRYGHQQSRWWDWVEALSEPDMSSDDRAPKVLLAHDGAIDRDGAERHRDSD